MTTLRQELGTAVSWIETTTAAADTAAVATRTASAGQGDQHFVTGVSGGFDAAVTGAKLVLKDGTTEIGRWIVYDTFALVFPFPIQISADTDVNLELDAGGTGIVGSVTLSGYTL